MTSIEWFIKEIEKHDKEFCSFYGAEITQAKEMHKQQVINTFKDAQVLKVMNDGTRGEQYYNERFKQ